MLSEGAEWEGYTVKEYGEPDAFGHRKKMSVAEDAERRDQGRDRRGDDRQRPDLRPALAASPDFVDKLVAATFARHGDRRDRRKASTG